VDARASWAAELRRGIDNWTAVLGEHPAVLSGADRRRLERLVGAFGADPQLFPAVSQARMRSRWRRGLLDEALEQDPIRVPVCPDAIDYTARQLGWADPEQREARRDDIELVAAAAVLESGSPERVTDEQWAAIREAFAFGDALLELFGSPAPGLEGPAGSSEIDEVSSEL